MRRRAPAHMLSARPCASNLPHLVCCCLRCMPNRRRLHRRACLRNRKLSCKSCCMGAPLRAAGFHVRPLADGVHVRPAQPTLRPIGRAVCTARISACCAPSRPRPYPHQRYTQVTMALRLLPHDRHPPLDLHACKGAFSAIACIQRQP
jgi:hypothetical protein